MKLSMVVGFVREENGTNKPDFKPEVLYPCGLEKDNKFSDALEAFNAAKNDDKYHVVEIYQNPRPKKFTRKRTPITVIVAPGEEFKGDDSLLADGTKEVEPKAVRSDAADDKALAKKKAASKKSAPKKDAPKKEDK